MRRLLILLLGVCLSMTLAPATADHLIPSPAAAVRDEPPIYYNGCHSWPPHTRPLACTYGRATADKTVMLFGDSHAAHWFGAVRGVAQRERWRMLSLTKSSCPAADVFVRRYRDSVFHTSCRPWRTNVFRTFRKGGYGQVDVAVMSSWHFHQVLTRRNGKVTRGEQRARLWKAGMMRTLQVVSRHADQVIILRDSPQLPGGMQGYWRCIAANQHTPRRCGTTVRNALSARIWKAESDAAQQFDNVATLDLSTPFCAKGFCSPVDGRLLAFKDDNHFNQTYMKRHFLPLLRPVLSDAMQRAVEPGA
jgi:hypothetical protein